jgi:hypothetical protein
VVRAERASLGIPTAGVVDENRVNGQIRGFERGGARGPEAAYRSAPVAPATGPEAAGEFIGAPLRADEPARPPLVAHGVGQSFDRVFAGDDVTV